VPNDGDLYIRYSATDHGERDVPATADSWESPAIEVIGSGLGSGTIVAGVDQLVRVYVGNRGANTHTDAIVQVYATDWGTVNPWLQSLGGPAGTPGGPFTVVGNAAWDSNSEAVIDVGWHPDPSELGGADHLHVCLFANIYRPTDGAPQSDPPVWSIATNQHQAQRNCTLVASPLGQALAFGLKAGNVGKATERFTLEVRELADGKLTAVDTRQLASAAWLASARRQLGALAPARPATAVELSAGGRRGAKLELELKPGQQTAVSVHATPSDAKASGIHRFQVVQRDARGRVVGGARAVVAVVPEKLIPRPLLEDARRLAALERGSLVEPIVKR